MEREADYRSEYFDGQIVAMSGGTLPHSRMGVRLLTALESKLRGRGCTPVNSDLRTAVAPKGPYFYPDAAIYCGEPQLADDYADMLLNPVVIFEILSKSTESFDRGYKFQQYRRIESLREYVLIDQAAPRIEVYSKGPDAKWTLTDYEGCDAVCELPSVGIQIALSDLYDAPNPEPAV
jgi:Uma2 family endonuclease